LDYNATHKQRVIEQFQLYVNDSQKHPSEYDTRSHPPAPAQAFDLTPDNIRGHLDIAIEQQYLLLDHETFYVYDLSKEKDTPYNTLVFQLSGSPLKSLETTTQVMTRYFKHVNVDYRWIRQFGQALKIKSCCPFVLGSHYFTPDRGVVRRHANWIAFHHVLGMHPHKDGTFFNIEGRHQLLSRRSFKHMQHLTHQTRLLAESQHKITSEWLALLDNQAGTYNKNNIIDRLSTASVFTQPTPPLTSWMMSLIYFQSLDFLLQSLEEGDPLIDEIKARHQKNLLDDDAPDD